MRKREIWVGESSIIGPEKSTLVRPVVVSYAAAMRCYAFFLLMLIAASMGAQRAYSQRQDAEKDPWVCPTIYVDCPDAAGPTVRFTITVTAGVPADAKLTFNWTVSRGKIISGQGTSSISVDARGLEGKSFTAAVRVRGVPAGCPNKASCSTRVEHRRKRRR